MDAYKNLKEGDSIEIDPTNGKMRSIHQVTGVEKVGEIVKETIGIPTTGWGDSPMKRWSNIYKTTGTVWSYAEKYLEKYTSGNNENWFTDAFFGKNKGIKTAKDWHDIVDYVIEDVTEAKKASARYKIAGSGSW